MGAGFRLGTDVPGGRVAEGRSVAHVALIMLRDGIDGTDADLGADADAGQTKVGVPAGVCARHLVDGDAVVELQRR